MIDQEPIKTKPEPFLTLKIQQGETGARLECPEIGVGVGVMGSTTDNIIYLAKGLLANMIKNKSRTLLNRKANDSLPEDTTEEDLFTAHKVVEALDQGVQVEDLFK